MKIKSLSDIVSCNDCGVLIHIDNAQEVQVIVKGSAGGREHYCRQHRKHYYMRTTTSGYDRYYRSGGNEITNIAGGWFTNGKYLGGGLAGARAAREGPLLPL